MRILPEILQLRKTMFLISVILTSKLANTRPDVRKQFAMMEYFAGVAVNKPSYITSNIGIL